MSHSHAVELNSITKQYDKSVIIDSIDLKIDPAESFVLAGHNGAGKTTLMKLMLGLTQATTGELKILGQNPASRSFTNQRQAMGYLPESVSFYPHMSGLELLKYYAELKNVPLTEVNQRLEQVGLNEAANRRLVTYSKGMRQRLGLAQAILGTPKLLFLDEPTTGLDPSLRRDFYGIISDLRAGGTTVVISSHSLNEIEAQADRIALIKNGKMVACDSLTNLSKAVGFPVRTQLTVAAGSAESVKMKLAEHVTIEKTSDNTINLTCPESEKVSLLSHLAELGQDVQDVSITTPRLDEIYLHFMGEDRA